MAFSFKKYHVTFHPGLVLIGLGKSTKPVEGLIPLENKSIVSESTDIKFYQIDLSLSCTCSVIDLEFRHNIVKVALDPRGDSRVDLQTTLIRLWRNSLSITGQTHEKLTSICFFKFTNCQLRSRLDCSRLSIVRTSEKREQAKAWASENFQSYHKKYIDTVLTSCSHINWCPKTVMKNVAVSVS